MTLCGPGKEFKGIVVVVLAVLALSCSNISDSVVQIRVVDTNDTLKTRRVNENCKS